MAITEKPVSGATAPNDITETTDVDASAPVNITEKAATTSSAPFNIAEVSDSDAAKPNTVTKVTDADASAPNNITEKAASSPAKPVDLAEKSASSPAKPVNITEVTDVDAGAPSNIAEKSVSSPSAPSNISEKTTTGASAPANITEVAKAVFPRTLTPLVSMNFVHDVYAQDQRAAEFDDLFTYARNSNATFWNRRLDRNGKWETFLDTDVVGDVENLLTYSEQFDHADWTKNKITIAANATTSPNGTRTANKLIENTDVTTSHRVTQAATVANNTIYSFTVYAKTNGRDWIYLYDNQATKSVYFNISDGVIGTKSAGVAAAITHLNNGWVKCAMSATASGTLVDLRVYLTTSDGGGAYTGDGVSGIYIWGAQLTESAKPLPYVKSIASATTETFTESLRLEYDPITAEPKGALIETAGVNLLLRSEEFDNASWTKSDVTINVNNDIAPDGTTSADKILDSGANSSHHVKQNTAYVSSSNRSISIYAKAAGLNWLRVGNANLGNQYAWFDLSSGTVGTVQSSVDSATIASVGDGWFRCIVNVQSNGVVVNIFNVTDADNSSAHTGDGLSGVLLWGAMHDQLTFASSYIRTEGSTVTRVADSLLLPVAGNITGGNMTQVSKFSLLGVDSGEGRRVIEAKGDGTTSRIYVDGATNSIKMNSGSDLITVGDDALALDELKAVMTYDEYLHVVSGYLNGSFIDSTDAGTKFIPDASDYIGIGCSYNSLLQLNGHIKLVEIYEEAMTAQEVSLL